MEFPSEVFFAQKLKPKGDAVPLLLRQCIDTVEVHGGVVGGLQPVVGRFCCGEAGLHFLQKKGVAERLLRNGVLFQVNSSFLTGWRGRRRAWRLLKLGQIHFVGSDCHNLSDRPPNVAAAIFLLEKRFGSDFATAFETYGCELLLHSE